MIISINGSDYQYEECNVNLNKNGTCSLKFSKNKLFPFCTIEISPETSMMILFLYINHFMKG